MSKATPLLGLAAILAIATLTPRRARRAPTPALPAPAPKPAVAARPPTPRRARVDARHDALVPERPSPTTWVLVQTAPTFMVLATADKAQRLRDEMDVLAEMFDERNEQRPHRWEVRAAKPLTA